MARARNIKPSFFSDDELGELEPLARLLFIGMWTLADYKGEFEYRAKRVKVQILPFDDCDIDSLAISLDKSGFIRFYSDGEKAYCSVRNFGRHQNPHKNERDKGSEIPKYTESMRQLIDIETLTINRDKNGTARDKNETDPADSLFLIPDSPIAESDELPSCDGEHESEEAPAKKPNGKHNNKILFQQITEIYNDLLGGTLPRVEDLSEPRQRALKARCSKKIKSRDTGNPEFWSGYFGYVANKCPFLVGENKDGWIANFDWLIKEANFLKVIEGTYERQEKPNASH